MPKPTFAKLAATFKLSLEQAYEIIGSLGYATKMPCYTYSTPAKDCNTGSKLRKIPGSVCEKCYAMRGNFARPTIKAGLAKRALAMANPRWVPARVLVLFIKEKSGFFRWYSSGDLRHLGDLLKICAVARWLPHIKFWLPTHEYPVVNAFFAAGFKLPSNLVLRLSAIMRDGPPPLGMMHKYGVCGSRVSTNGRETCPASKQDNKCLDCRRCWDKRVKIVTYKYH